MVFKCTLCVLCLSSIKCSSFNYIYASRNVCACIDILYMQLAVKIDLSYIETEIIKKNISNGFK
jgi:hypothetical protein